MSFTHLRDLYLQQRLGRVHDLAQQFTVVVDDPVHPSAHLHRLAEPPALDDAQVVLADQYIVLLLVDLIADHVFHPAGEHASDMMRLRRQRHHALVAAGVAFFELRTNQRIEAV